MISFLRKTTAVIWLILPPVFLSALIHMADPDIVGWQGLASHSALWSAALLGVLFFPFVCLCLGTLIEYGLWAFLAASTILSAGSGMILTVFGSGATTVAGHAPTFAACTGMTLTIVLLAIMPAAALGWPQVFSERRKNPAPDTSVQQKPACPDFGPSISDPHNPQTPTIR